MDSFTSLRVWEEEKGLNAQSSPLAIATFVRLLKRVAGETSHLSNWSPYWQSLNVALGDRVYDFSTSNPKSASTQLEKNFVYLLCRGKVRVLATERMTGRQVSVQLLEPGAFLGVDGLFPELINELILSYQGVAATDVMVAKVPQVEMEEYFRVYPGFEEDVQQTVRSRQQLLFLKTQTSLSSFTSRDLLPLVTDLATVKVPQGEDLTEVIREYPGRYWLVKGQIDRSPIDPVQNDAGIGIISKGSNWGYPNPTEKIGVAKTDLLLYYLSAPLWDGLSVIKPEITEKITAANEIDQPQPIQRWATEEKFHEKFHEKFPWSHQPYLPTGESRSPSLEEEEGVGEAAMNSVVVDTDEAIAFLRQANLRQANTPHGSHHSDWKHSWWRNNWQTYPIIAQQSSSDCGAACLAMVSQYWGKRISLNTLRNLAQTTRTGASLPAMAAAAVNLGYRAFPIRVSLDILEWHTYPWIAHWRGIHYVVVWKIHGDIVTISDPAMGLRKITKTELIANWTGYALALDPTSQLDKLKSDRITINTFNNLWQRLWRYRDLLFQLFLASFLLQTFGLATPLITQIVIDRLFQSPVTSTLNLLALGFLGFGAWRIFMRGVRQYLLDYLSNHMDLTALSGFIRHTLRLPLQFFTSRQVADIITRIEENRKLQLFLTRQALVVGLDAIMTPICLVLMAHYNLRLTLLVLALILPIVMLTLITSTSLRRVSQDIARESARQNSAMIEIVKGIATVKSTGVERWVRWRWEERFANLVRARFRGQKLANTIQVLHSLINHVGNTAILWSGAILVIEDRLSVGQFVAFNMLIHSVVNPIFALLELRDRIPEVLVAVERLDDILTAPLEERPHQPLNQLPPLRGEVRFNRVCFRYTHDQTRHVLQNIDFHLLPGQTIGIVGTQSSGKSTLVNLLAGLYKPSAGTIFIDGKDISHSAPQTLRSQIGIVSQDCFLFSGTVLENICAFNREFDLDQVVQAAKLAGVHSFIENLPLAYQTQIGDSGRMLPKSVRQQIAIARTLIRNPYVCIFDAATTALPPETEQQILQNLWHNTRVRTILVVTNRQTTLQQTDQILVLDRGTIVQTGTHSELSQQNGLYANLSRQYLHL